MHANAVADDVPWHTRLLAKVVACAAGREIGQEETNQDVRNERAFLVHALGEEACSGAERAADPQREAVQALLRLDRVTPARTLPEFPDGAACPAPLELVDAENTLHARVLDFVAQHAWRAHLSGSLVGAIEMSGLRCNHHNNDILNAK